MKHSTTLLWSGYLSLALSLLTAATVVAASDRMTLYGFGTLAMACFDNSEADFRHNSLSEGPGRSRRCDAELDSKAGAQLNYRVSPTIEGSLQAALSKKSDNDFAPTVTIASLLYTPSPAWNFTLGRYQNPNLIHSASRLVTYTQPWVRPPREVYGAIPVYDVDGVEVSYHADLGGVSLESRFGIYTSEEILNINEEPIEASVDKNIFVNFTGFYNNITLQMGLISGATTAEPAAITALVTTLSQLGYHGLAEEMSHQEADSLYLYGGFIYESGQWLLTGEMIHSEFDSYLSGTDGTYLTVGRYLDKWLLHLTWGWRERAGRDISAQVTQPPLAASLEGVRSASSIAHDTLVLGVNYSLSEQMILKSQLDWIRPRAGDAGASYVNHSSAYNRDDPGRDLLFTIALDFII
ncbi:hypothetical protein D5085_15460 [Ectothiorhodospiraceae bacterium BW-2]|nr:hypothetical protein D5085_15460 [Ectothiorhodospiraceae bacterium BW-2]